MMEMTTKFQSIQEEQNYLPILLVFSLHNQQKKLRGKNVSKCIVSNVPVRIKTIKLIGSGDPK